ncbi:nuclear transport factor 2 family protein [Streptomyces sp. NBC_00038]|uniref:nuclear transport factor 2 family protein n=1 Tax=Streptomyces sp. NBC_00038 TaxID=2903615 RepID=UPI0022572B37|nr:nuclear transport factor 2 family protein [Streptomyces sp. NBC_00038]MCX5557432.1 nuclear transport factor 2 family protein [Streptomyces sp. NBC_00038]
MTANRTKKEPHSAKPVAHHVTNIVIAGQRSDRVRVRSKGLGVMKDGTCGSVTYDDTLVRGDKGWRIYRRMMEARRVPFNGVTGQDEELSAASAGLTGVGACPVTRTRRIACVRPPPQTRPVGA